MSSLVTSAFEAAREAGSRAFIPYMTAGYPDIHTFLEIISAFDRAGADIIEIGLPFSDPMADGPVIQTSSRKVLDQGVTPRSVLDLVARVRVRTSRPIVLMSYVNPVLKYGYAEFALRLKEMGGQGMIIPDLPVEEAGEWLDAADRAEIDAVFMAAPTTTPERLSKTAAASRGFLYYVPITGVTGSALAESETVADAIQSVRKESRVPVAVGFGVSTPGQAARLAAVADGVIVGSALVREVQKHETAEEQVEAVYRLARSIKDSLSAAGRKNEVHHDTAA